LSIEKALQMVQNGASGPANELHLQMS
jgi:hypothetical protein